jgi:DNA polymerase
LKELHIDIETYSSINLSKSGVYRYAEASDFEILLFGYSIDDGPVSVVDLTAKEKLPRELLDALTDDAVIKWAFNANFERICLSSYLRRYYPRKLPSRYLNPKSWRCSMIWSAYLGLPLSLKGAGEALGLEEQKLTEGKDLIRYFCMPCKGTKANGGRTRNLPSDAMEKWNLFKAYNKRDVEVEMAIQKKLSNYPVPDFVWEEYHLDQEINDRGIRIDETLVQSAISIDEKSKQKLTRKLKDLTGLENPNSVMQMKSWLRKRGITTDTLGKKAVAELIKTAPPDIQEVLKLRQRLAKSSVRKYQAMENAACTDQRARGMFQFYGANRSGRFSGRLIQLQNLPRNTMPDLKEARDMVKTCDYESLKLLYDDIPDTLSQLIRTAFIPRDGYKFIVSDFSSIEARVLAWLAKETHTMDAFAKGEDIYCSTASAMFGVPVVKHGINGELRQKGKIAVLACIAEGEKVLTNHGLRPIEKVTKDDLLWDGISWVKHDGVIYRGRREVITYEGLTATPDHLVFIEGKPRPVYLAEAARSGAHLIKTGNSGQAIWLGENHQSSKEMEPNMESLLRINPVHWLRKNSVDGSWKSEKRKIQGLSALLSTKENTEMAGQTAYRCKAEMHKSKGQKFSKLRRPRNKIRIRVSNRSRTLSYSYFRTSKPGNGNRPDQQQWKLCTRKYPVRNSQAEPGKQKKYCIKRIPTEILALRQKCCGQKAESGIGPSRNYRKCRAGSQGKEEKLAAHRGKVRVYDIRNAGPNHRFTVSGKLVHNCGYGGSVGALKAMGALEMGLTEDELPGIVSSWRKANPNIVKLWWDVDRAVKTAVKNKAVTKTHSLTIKCQSQMLFITLPSGRRLSYVKPQIGENRFGEESVTYMGVGQAKKWERIESYGPKFVENIIQAIARDILCYAMRTLSDCSIVAHVHDELIIECPMETEVKEICDLMGRTPPWAPGLLLRADGYECVFYKKD